MGTYHTVEKWHLLSISFNISKCILDHICTLLILLVLGYCTDGTKFDLRIEKMRISISIKYHIDTLVYLVETHK